jgi:hypothetical protein
MKRNQTNDPVNLRSKDNALAHACVSLPYHCSGCSLGGVRLCRPQGSVGHRQYIYDRAGRASRPNVGSQSRSRNDSVHAMQTTSTQRSPERVGLDDSMLWVCLTACPTRKGKSRQSSIVYSCVVISGLKIFIRQAARASKDDQPMKSHQETSHSLRNTGALTSPREAIINSVASKHSPLSIIFHQTPSKDSDDADLSGRVIERDERYLSDD